MQYSFEPMFIVDKKNIYEFRLLKLLYINYKYMSYNTCTLKWISYFQIVDYKNRGQVYIPD